MCNFREKTGQICNILLKKEKKTKMQGIAGFMPQLYVKRLKRENAPVNV